MVVKQTGCSGSTMLRITVLIDTQETTLQLEGRLAGRMVEEAELSWRTLLAQNPDRPIRVDLNAITYIDGKGKDFLRQAHQYGAQFMASGCLTKAYIEEITRAGSRLRRGS